MPDLTPAPESSAVRVALWRAIHVQFDPPPLVIEDEVGLRLVAPDDGWRDRPDMHPQGTKVFRASILARARFVEDVVTEQAGQGVSQYVILGAGLDTFAQRRPEIASKLRLFEVDQAGPQAWKQQRLIELGYGIPDRLRFVPVNFETDSWWIELTEAGFDPTHPTVIASTGVSMYLTKEAVKETLRQIATLGTRSTLVMSFMLPFEFANPEIRPWLEMAEKGARASGTPFLSYFTPTEIMDLATEAGFKKVRHVSADALADRYFSGRTDGLRPPRNTEELLIANT